ncbi:MAG: hypothetical protein JJ863_30540 [Deltaproteobacteria bacterium]|nr:hypothetical protein [Deltaproteobacteria bacterium]
MPRRDVQTILLVDTQTNSMADKDVLTRRVEEGYGGVPWIKSRVYRGIVENLWEARGVLWIKKSH